MTGAPASVRLDKVSAGYHRKPVLEQVSLQIPYGSFAALLGANGSGKTTLLKTVAGILPPLAGSIDFTPIAGRRPGLGFVPQRESLDPHYPLTSLDVVLMGALGRIGPGRPIPKEEKEFARSCLKRVGAERITQRMFAELSGGQKQKVLVARALVTRPDALLLDEPTAGLDAATAQEIMELFAELNRSHGMTLLMVNHDLSAVRRYAREVIWLRNGGALQGTVQEMITPERFEQLLECH